MYHSQIIRIFGGQREKFHALLKRAPTLGNVAVIIIIIIIIKVIQNCLVFYGLFLFFIRIHFIIGPWAVKSASKQIKIEFNYDIFPE